MFTPGGSLIGMTSNASAVFVANNTNGVFKTTDNGATWPKVSPGGITNFASAIVATSTNLFIGVGSSMYKADAAGTTKWGVYRSTDAATWSPANTGMLAHKIDGVHISNGYLYAAADGRGFFRSADHGTTWSEIDNGIAAYPGWYCFARTAAGTLLGGNGNGMLFRSTDNGDT